MRIREIKTGSGKRAIQVVSKRDGRLTVHKHIGTFASLEQKTKLYEQAQNYIQNISGQTNIFSLLNTINFSDIKITESKPLFTYQMLSEVYFKIGFNKFEDPVLKDLIIARVCYPTSKLETQEILAEFFGKNYGINTLYRHLKKAMFLGIQECFQAVLINFAKQEIRDSLKLVFYDVTTLYFESSIKTELKDFGFSKDHRTQDTQIVLGLVVTSQGFPLYFDIFNGKTFEGNTFIPVIEKIIALLNNPKLIVVADAAMISQKNIDMLQAKNIGFIVGARVANLPLKTINFIADRILGDKEKVISLPYQKQKLICEYSSKRANKDKSDRNKQISKALQLLASPSTSLRRFRFIKIAGKNYQLNSNLIAKAEKLEGIKGYITNTDLPSNIVIDRYKDLWKVEHSFRVTKSDLKARPIFHRLDDAIKAHVIIVFAALAISRYIEIKTGLSIKKALKISKKLLTHKVTNTKTGESNFMETSIEDKDILDQISLLKTLGH